MRLWTALLLAASLFAQRKPVDDAWDLLLHKQRPEAIRLLRQIIAANPADADARLLLGSVLQEEGDRDEAISQLTEAVRLRPSSAEAQNALGEALHTFGQIPASRAPFQKAVTLDPNLADARVNFGWVLFDSGEFDAAAVHLDRALQLFGNKPDAAFPHYLRAKICTARDDLPDAVRHLEQAVSLRPDFAEAWSDLGEARHAVGDDAGSLAALDRAVALAPDDAVAQTRLGARYLEQQQPHPAVSHLEKAVQLDPHNQTALYSLQRALRADGQSEQADAVKKQLADLLLQQDRAEQAFLSAIQINNQGAALEKSGNLAAAVEKYRAARELAPSHAGIRVNYAVALMRLGRWKDGLDELRGVVRLDPNNPRWKAALDDALWQAPVSLGGQGRPPKSLAVGTRY